MMQSLFFWNENLCFIPENSLCTGNKLDLCDVDNENDQIYNVC